MAEQEGTESSVRNATAGIFDIPELQAQAEALAAAVRGEQLGAETPAATSPQPAAPQGGEAVRGIDPTQSASPEAQSVQAAQQSPPTAEGTGEPPTEYMGIDMTEVPSEVRHQILGALQGQDKFIQKLMRREPVQWKARDAQLAQSVEESAQEVARQFQGQVNEATGAQAPEGQPATPFTDVDLLMAYGIDPNDPDLTERDIKLIMPALREQVKMETLLNEMFQERLVDKTVMEWNSALDSLEGEYGDLPPEITRSDLFSEAVKSGVSDPVDAYWRVIGPARKHIMDEVKKARADTLRSAKLAQSTLRPQSAVETESKEVTAKTVRGAIAEAAMIAEDETGYSWKDVLKARADSDYMQ